MPGDEGGLNRPPWQFIFSSRRHPPGSISLMQRRKQCPNRPPPSGTKKAYRPRVSDPTHGTGPGQGLRMRRLDGLGKSLEALDREHQNAFGNMYDGVKI
jgi:hypothetical protein